MKPLSIKHTLILVGLTGVTIPVGLFTYFRVDYELRKNSLILNNRISQFEGILKNGIKEPLWNFTSELAEPVLTNIMLDSSLRSIEVRDQFDRIFISQTKKLLDAEKTMIEVRDFPIVRENKVIGSVKLQYSTVELNDEFLAAWEYAIFELLITFLFAIVPFSYALKVRLFNPLSILTKHARLLSKTHLKEPFLWKYGTDELTQVNEAMEISRRHLAELMDNLKTQNDELEQRVSEKTSQLLQASKMSSLGQMAAGIAHEINNPLAIIVGKATQIERNLAKQLEIQPDHPLKSDIARAQSVLKTAGRISTIIRGLKSFARDDSHDPFERAQFQDLVQETLGFCSGELTDHRIKIEVKMPEVPVFVECRPTQISQVMVNLLHNSGHAIASNAERWIRIEGKILETDATQFRLTITDSGPGIPIEVANKMFDPFFTTKETGKGTGLGLSISIGILEMHHGKLWLNRESPNTQFVLDLPLVQTTSKKAAA